MKNIVLLSLLVFLFSCSNSNDGTSEKKENNKDKAQIDGKFNKENAKDLKQTIEKSDSASNKIVEEANLGSQNDCEVSLDAYVDDPSETATNIRKTPGGEVVLKLPYAQDEYFLSIVDQKGAWFKVLAIEGIEDSYPLPEGGAWIHKSVVGAGTRNYGNQKINLYQEHSEDSPVVSTLTEESGVHIQAVCGDWVKIETLIGSKVGWVKKEWICGNPLTNCS